MTAATPNSTLCKKRPVTYGQKHSPSIFNNKDLDFFNHDDNDLAVAKIDTVKRPLSNTRVTASTTPLQSLPMNHMSLSAVPKDVFVFPSSEDELEVKTTKTPARPVPKRPLVVDHVEQIATASTLSNSKMVKIDGSLQKNVTFAKSNSQSSQDIALPVHTKAVTITKSSPVPVLDQSVLQGMSTIDKLKYRRGQLMSMISGESSTSSPTSMESPSSEDIGTQHRVGQLKRTQTSPRSRSSTMTINDHASRSLFAKGPNSQVHNGHLSPSPDRDTMQVDCAGSARPSRRDMSPPVRGLTPKQKRLWEGVFGRDDDVQRSVMGSEKRPRSHNFRLVDRLRAAAPAKHADEDEESVMLLELDDNTEAIDTISIPSPAAKTKGPVPTSVSKVTYGNRQRTILADEGLEDSTPLDFSPIKSLLLSDMNDMPSTNNDEDAEAAGAKLRSVHELRARGRSSRATAEIETLLQDALDQALKQVSRIAALIKLVTMLLQEDVARTFINNDNHIKLMATSDAVDDLTSCLLVIASILLLLHDSVDVVSDTAHQCLAATTSLLNNTTNITDLLSVEGNLSKVAISLSKLTKQIIRLESLWQDTSPPQILTPRILYLRALDMLSRRSTPSATQDIILHHYRRICPHGYFVNDNISDHDHALVMSILESNSSLGSVSLWPVGLIEAVASLPYAISNDHNNHFSQHTRFLAYRLCLNVTNTKDIDHLYFARTECFCSLLDCIITGFEVLPKLTIETDGLNVRLDMLILALGIVVNISEYSKSARETAGQEGPAFAISQLIEIFNVSLKRVREALSVNESTVNVAYGYLAVMLASLCQNPIVRTHIVSKLRHQDLGTLITAVEEFIKHHQRVDSVVYNGAEGQEALTVFTQRLGQISSRLTAYI